jgi:hypothetical protein
MNKIWDLKTKLSNQYKMMNCRSCKHYLEMHITHNKIQWTLILLQKTYLKKMLKNFELKESKAVTTFMKLKTYLMKSQNTEIVSSQLIKKYQSVIKFLMYTMTQTHFNIIYVMSTLSQFTHNSNKTHWKVLKQMFHYVCETLDVSIEYDLKLMNEWLKLQRYSDLTEMKTLKKVKQSEYFSWLMNQFSEVWNIRRLLFYFLQVNI